MWIVSIRGSGQNYRKVPRASSIHRRNSSIPVFIDYNLPSRYLISKGFCYMALISVQDVSIGFGGPRLLEEINLQIESEEWIGLLGRNGMGKSTLLKLISGEILPHSGTIARQQDIRVAYLPQEVPQGLSGTVREIVESGLEVVASGTLDDEH